MKKITTKKKGFTIVELVIVIAVIGILSAILIPTFINLNNKARVANTTSFLKSINTQIAMKEANEGLDGADVGGFTTMFSGVDYALKRGFDLEEISPFEGNEIVWDEANHRFAFVNGEEIVYSEAGFELKNAQYMPDSPADLTSMAAAGKKVYVKAKVASQIDVKKLTVYNSFDAGNSKDFVVTYKPNTAEHKAIVRTNGDQTILNVYAPEDDVMFYGFAKEINVADVAPSSLHVYGAVSELALEKGHVEIEPTGIVFDVTQIGNALENSGEGATITNNGYVAEVSLEKHVEAQAEKALEDAGIENPTAEQKAAAVETAKVNVEAAKEVVVEGKVSGTATIGADLEISSLAHLEAFRDAVNAGNNFAGKKVYLKANITLDDGWRPIGEGTREIAENNVVATHVSTFFRGEFNGNGYTISNLNNKGFIPSDDRLKLNQYSYGLFALVGDGAVIKNVKLADVDIDTTRYADSDGDSVGALIGYSDGSLEVSDVTVVNGLVKGLDGVGGIIGRSYKRIKNFDDGVALKPTFTYNISNCKNNARVSASETKSGAKAGGIVGFISSGVTNYNFVSCENTGNVTAYAYAGGVVVYGQLAASGAITNCSNAGTIKSITTLPAYIADSTVSGTASITQSGNTNTGKAYRGDSEVTADLIANIA